MKVVKSIIIIMLVMLLGIVSYGNENSYDGYYRLIETFEKTGSDFKFYNVKANLSINNKISQTEINELMTELAVNLGLDEKNINIEKDGSKSMIYAGEKGGNTTISIIGTIKSEKESYIMVDIFDNKLYKNIVDIYKCIENTLNLDSSRLEIYTCISGEYTKKLQNKKYDDILHEILYNMNATVIEKVEDDNFLSINANSKLLNKYYLEYLGHEMNLNIGLRYSENEEKTTIYLATPIIKLDY